MFKKNGFTIVELLIVIVVIGILAAISIVAYNGIQSRARQSIIESDLNAIAKKLAMFEIDHSRYPANHELVDLDFSASHDAYPSNFIWNLEYCASLDFSEYIVTVFLDNRIVYVSSNSGSASSYEPEVAFIPVVRDGEPTGGYLSPCYSGVPYSAADRAGLGQVGVLDASNAVIEGHGSSGKDNKGWKDWAL